MATTLGSVAEGSIVYLNESGSPAAFYVAKHDYESALNGAGRTLLVRQDCYNKGAWGASGAGNEYSGSVIDNLFETTYRNLLDGFVQEALAPTTIYYTPGGGGLGDDHPVSTIKRSIFALSLTELGRSYSTMSNVEGTALPIADTLRIANYNGSAVTQWTRSRALNKEASALCVSANGQPTGYSATATGYARRPALTLPAEMGVDDNGNVTEPVAASAPHGAMIDDVACPITECYVEIDGVRCQVPYGLTTIDGVTMTIPFGPSAETIEQYPSIVGNLTYTGSAQSPQWTDYDSSKMSIGGTQSGTNAGSYTTTFTPLEGYVWPDGSTDAYSVTWSIAKAAGSVTLSKTSISLGSGESTTFTVTRSGDGTISVSSSATGRATATLSGTTVTVKGVATGSATITVSVAEGTNHLAASATCAVKMVQMYTVTITRKDGANWYPGSRNAAYFQINGTQYYGNDPVTLQVASGTSYRAYAKVTNPMNQQEAGTVTLNGKEVARGKAYDGKITSNTTVVIGIYDFTSGTISVGYGIVEITTS